ncbi:MAG: 50S ribosomal protein L21e [Candidatus Hodarchaeales archaeon]|jgi:large subunit ribosomal protein L21e
MVKKSKGLNFRTRKIFSKHPRKRGLPSLSRTLTNYEVNSKVNIVIEPSVQKGRPHRRFHGKTGIVLEKRGQAYLIQVSDGKSFKKIIARPEHLKAQLQ